MAVDIVITEAGRAALVNAQNTGTDPVTIAQVGLTATAFTAAASATSLPGEFKRIGAVAGEVVANDTIHVNLTDESADAYDLRGIGLYLADGTLFGLYGQAAPILSKVAASIGAIAIDVIFADISAALLTFGNANFTNPPATTERSGVVELATVAEAQAGIDALRALTPAGARAAILGWLLSMDGSGSGLDADLLDGQHGSFYTNIPARLGYTPANRAGDTFTGNVSVSLGDLATWRSGGLIGFVGLNQSGSRYLLNNGSSYVLPGQSLFVNDGIAWTAVNDGAGSGLDADLLDGQHGSFYLAAGSYTAADVFAKVLSLDGAGSGLDADLLNGQQGSFYTNIPARLGYTPVNKAGDTITGNLNVASGDLATWRTGGSVGFVGLNQSGSRYLLNNGSAYVLPGQSLFVDGAIAWTAGNDGPGSGLDADLLDGQHGSFYLAAGSYTAADVFAKVLSLDGSGSGLDADLLDGLHASDFMRAGSGAQIRYGEAAHADASGAQEIVFATPFPNGLLAAVACNLASAVPVAFHAVGAGSRFGITVFSASAPGTPAGAGTAFSWIAIGY